MARIPARVQMCLQREGFAQERLVKRLEMSVQACLQSERHRQELCLQRVENALSVRMQVERHRLELFSQRVKAASPDLLLKRGYSMTLKDGKAVTDASLLQPGDVVETRLAKGRFKSKVMEE